METLADLIAVVLLDPLPGVYNLGSREGMSKRDFAHALARHLELSTANTVDGTCREAGRLARRPSDMRMDSTRFEACFGAKLPTLADEIRSVRRSA